MDFEPGCYLETTMYTIDEVDRWLLYFALKLGIKADETMDDRQLCDEIQEAFDCVEQGYYFGYHPDLSDLGFWPIKDEDWG